MNDCDDVLCTIIFFLVSNWLVYWVMDFKQISNVHLHDFQPSFKFSSNIICNLTADPESISKIIFSNSSFVKFKQTIRKTLCFIESRQNCRNHTRNPSESLNFFLLCSIFAESRHDGDCCWLEPIGEIAMYVKLHINVYWLFHRSTFFSSRSFVLFAPRLSISCHQYEASRWMHRSVSNGDGGEQRRL